MPLSMGEQLRLYESAAREIDRKVVRAWCWGFLTATVLAVLAWEVLPRVMARWPL